MHPTGRRDPVPYELMLERLAAVLALLVLPVTVSLLDHGRGTHRAVRDLAGYSPWALSHGLVWTLPGSAFLLPRVAMIGPTTIMVVFVFLPYALTRGVLRALATFIGGHVAATLAVALVVVPGAALGWPAARTVYLRSDVGASAGLAACLGGLAVVAGRRNRGAGAVVLVGGLAFFAYGMLVVGGAGHGVVDVEHLVALASGVGIEVLAGAAERRRVGVPGAP